MQAFVFRLFPIVLCALTLASLGCAKHTDAPTEAPTLIKTLDLQYAKRFNVGYYSDGTIRVRVQDEERELVLFPRGSKRPSDGALAVEFPVENVYMASTASADLFLKLDSLDKIAAIGIRAPDCAVPEISSAIEAGKIAYVGKYGAPDFEKILGLGCDLAIESTMIYHSPKTKEQLERLGVPVFVERAAYEEDPLGRLEWIKLYGALLGKDAEAAAYFDAQKAKVGAILAKRSNASETPKTVALFYVSSAGSVNVRRPGDYYCKLIELAGGRYAFDDLPLDRAANSQSAIALDWEAFYREAVGADVLIYNGTVDSEVDSIADLLAKNPLFADFKAVKTGSVWRSNAVMHQATGTTADVVEEFFDMLNSERVGDYQYLKKLQ